jgi:hypothetical protein
MATPNLGYGKQTEATLDQVNVWMRGQPWYQQIRGTSPKLNDAQRKQILQAAQAHGVVIDEGDVNVDSSGNLDNKGHKLRNTIIVAGIAAAAIAAPYVIPAMTGAGAGGGAAAAAMPAATGVGGMTATSLGLGTTAGLGTAGAAAAATGGTAATVAGVTPGVLKATTSSSLTGSDALRYGLPVAGNLIGGVIQARAEGKASDAQMKYLEEALAYQKEQDAYTRKTDEERYGYSRDLEASRYGYTRDLEASRYGDYSSRIDPYVQTGTSANDRMASLLGLPARGPAPAMVAPPQRPAAPQAPSSAPPAASPAAAPVPPTYPQPIGGGGTVLLQGPDGSQRQVAASQVQHYVDLGATVIQGAA